MVNLLNRFLLGFENNGEGDAYHQAKAAKTNQHEVQSPTR